MNRTSLHTIGILGGGQLALMLARAASQLGIRVRVLESGPDCPAKRSVAECVQGSWEEPATLQAFAQGCDLLTLENEFVSAPLLEELEKLGHTVLPSSATMRLVQDKLIQKQTLRAAGLPVVDFVSVENQAAAQQALKLLGLPCVLKRRTLGYDGTGNFTIRCVEDLEKGVERLGGYPAGLYLEKWCDFSRELAVMVTRGKNAGTAVYPVVETVQENHVCSTVVAPAAVADTVATQVQQIAQQAVESLGGVGTFGVELFEEKDGTLRINEMAPRVHNSGHYTSEACDCSQFENHIRAILGWPLGSTKLRSPAAMVNLLAAKHASGTPAGLAAALEVPGAQVHLYGKLRSAPGRKMGHVTALGPDTATAVSIAKRAASLITFEENHE